MTHNRQDKLFHWNQKAFYKEFGGKRRGTSHPLQADDTRKF